MPTIVLASSGKFVTGKNLDKYLPKKLKDCKIAFIITASKKARHLEYMTRHRARMDELGWDYTEIDIARKTKIQLEKMLSQYDVVVMGGGNTFYLLKCVRKSGFQKVLKKILAKGIIYIGISAGAYITCPSIIVSDWSESETDHFGVTDFTAINWVSFLIKAHYKPDELDKLKAQVKTQFYPLRLLTDNQALVIKDGKIKFIGKGKEIILPGAKTKQ